MGWQEENSRISDVIYQYKLNGTIIPIKLRLVGDDGRFQAYKVWAYKELTQFREYVMPEGNKLDKSYLEI